MTITISSIANVAIHQMFASLEGVLQKGAAHAKSKDVEDGVYLNWRMAPDMFPLARQVAIATELPARALSRLAGADVPAFDDDAATFAALLDRVAKAREHISGLSEDAIDADPDADITVPVGPDQEMTFSRRMYLQTFILPNLYFHVTAAYVILRRLGVDIGKRDFLAVPQS